MDRNTKILMAFVIAISFVFLIIAAIMYTRQDEGSSQQPAIPSIDSELPVE